MVLVRVRFPLIASGSRLTPSGDVLYIQKHMTLQELITNCCNHSITGNRFYRYNTASILGRAFHRFLGKDQWSDDWKKDLGWLGKLYLKFVRDEKLARQPWEHDDDDEYDDDDDGWRD